MLERNALIALVVGCLLSLINPLDILISDPLTVLLGTMLFLFGALCGFFPFQRNQPGKPMN